ncbi:MAG: hypothetical protein JST28_15120 [Acidobacteria bacterium]|nr:hypothetical protein [Acidobacteriota bacterium]
MRLIPVCLSLVLAPLVVVGQQTQPTTAQKAAQPAATKHASPTAPHKTATRHRSRHRSRKASRRAKHTEPTTIPVDVINGGETRHVNLDKTMAAPEHAKGKSGQVKVDVINGSSTDTQYFSDNNQEAAHNQSVVVDVQSGDTKFADGNKSPVVTGIASSSSVDAKSASSGGQPVARQVSPRPKRPAYTPDGH